MSLARVLRHPCRQTAELDRAAPRLGTLPYRAWAWLAVFAVAGSTTYGASLSFVLPRWRPVSGAAWLALSAGLSWGVFWPFVARLARRNPWTVLHACLVTIAYGEVVLLSGAVSNWLAARRGWRRLDPGLANLGWVGLSNVVMATAATRQLGAVGVPARTTLLAWFGVLDGLGALLFWLFRRLLREAR